MHSRKLKLRMTTLLDAMCSCKRWPPFCGSIWRTLHIKASVSICRQALSNMQGSVAGRLLVRHVTTLLDAMCSDTR